MKILVRATNWVGDAVMCIPALEAVRARWPQAEITILARAWVADVYEGQGLANEIIEFEHTGKHRGLGGIERLARELRAEKFDVALLLQNAFEAAWIAKRAAIRERIGYARDGRGWLLTKSIARPQPGEIPAHEVFYYLNLVRQAGWLPAESPHEHAFASAQVPQIHLRVNPASAEESEQTLTDSGAGPGRLRIALAPGAAYGSAKCWPTDRYAALADRLVADFDANVILFGSPGEREVAERIAQQMKHRPVMLAGQTPIGDLPALFSRCGIFIGNDSGAMHVAAAVGLPVVAIFGPTDPHGTRPATAQFALVQEKVSCSPCFLRHCPVDHRCMTRVAVEPVYEAAQKWIAQIGTPGASKPPRRAVFLDRDGTICEEMGYMNHLRRFAMLRGSANAIRELNRKGIPVIVVTNQSGVARGFFPESLVHQVHDRLETILRRRGAHLEAIYYCPHVKADLCKCRKPLTGMLQQAAREHNLQLKGSWVVSDRYADVQMSHAAGGHGVLVLSGYGRGEYTWNRKKWPRQPDVVAEDLAAAVRAILRKWS